MPMQPIPMMRPVMMGPGGMMPPGNQSGNPDAPFGPGPGLGGPGVPGGPRGPGPRPGGPVPGGPNGPGPNFGARPQGPDASQGPVPNGPNAFPKRPGGSGSGIVINPNAQMQPFVSYMPCIVPASQWHQMQSTGAVAVAHVDAAQVQSGQLNLQALFSQIPGMGMMAQNGNMNQGQNWGKGGPSESQGGKGASGPRGRDSRDARGRSPPRGRRPAPGSGGPGGPPNGSGNGPSNPARPGLFERSSSKDAWRPAFLDPEQAAKRRDSLERRLSADGRSPPPRQSSKERSDRSPERRTSLEPSGVPRRAKPFGIPKRLNFPPQNSTQISGQWAHQLTDGSSASVYLIADQMNLQQAASRLNNLQQGAIIVMDCHGQDLRAAAGKLCLLVVAFSDANGLQVFMFDVLQLGEQLYTLVPFFTNANASKITADATTHATLFAHKFGINLNGVIDAQWAYETLEKKSMVNATSFLDWCGLAPPQFKEEAARMEQNPEMWGQRPLPNPALMHATDGICLLHSASAVMWTRLAKSFGNTVFNMVANASRQRVEMAAAAGWACRNAGLWTAEQDYANEEGNKEAELDDWLARRFGKAPEKPQPAASLRARSADKPALPESAFRRGDSPRTAAWRAVMAQMNPPRITPSRQRSASPTLENWLSRRGSARERRAPGASHRASSLPSRDRERDKDEETFEEYRPRPLQPLNFDNINRKPWAEIVEEGDEEVFEDLNKAEHKRLNQAEISKKR